MGLFACLCYNVSTFANKAVCSFRRCNLEKNRTHRDQDPFKRTHHPDTHPKQVDKTRHVGKVGYG